MNGKYQKLISWVEDIKEQNHSSAAGLLVLKDNRVVLEHYSGNHSNSGNSRLIDANSQFNVASARKSYLGLAVAYALYEGKINSIDDCVTDYFTDLDSELLRKTTLRHLVTHSHGLNEDEKGNMYREFEPGEGWAYRGINVELMTKLFQRIYNKNFSELLKERIFNPLNFKESTWQTEDNDNLVKVINDPKQPRTSKLGTTNNGMDSNLFVSTREFADWGNLHLNRGVLLQ